MLFNSTTFLLFFVCIYLSYILLSNTRKGQNILLLAASYYFYGSWDWRFLSLILISTMVDFIIGKSIVKEENPRRKKGLLLTSVFVNLSILGFFKYFNFFAASLGEFFLAFGITLDTVTLNIILPVGISFYTFQTLSYTIDIYRGKMSPTKDLLDFALFVSFFPQLVAGPIERAKTFLPQIQRPRTIKAEQVHAGLFLIIWGYFKKVVIADNAALICNEIFNNYTDYTGFELFVGVLAFSIQIYGDFSAYSDIARGLAKLMGFELMVNFKLPYSALNPSDFWRRWHISLSTWLKDYLYIPLGGNKFGRFLTLRNLMITMLLGGLWHGAHWNFILWGAYHGTILILYRLLDKRDYNNLSWHGLGSISRNVVQMGFMFILTLYGWLLFRAETMDQIIYFSTQINFIPLSTALGTLAKLLFYAAPLFLMQVWQYRSNDLLVPTKLPPVGLSVLYSVLLLGIFILGVRESSEFIYFQF